MTVIGGADGPTSIFITDSFGWISVFGLIIVVLLLIPNILWALTHRGAVNACESKVMNILEQVGRYGSMLFMVLKLGGDAGFSSAGAFAVYLIGSTVLILLYWLFFALCFKKPRRVPTLMAAILPPLIFLLSGVTLLNWPLIAFAVLFGVAHIYVTVKNLNN